MWTDRLTYRQMTYSSQYAFPQNKGWTHRPRYVQHVQE